MGAPATPALAGGGSAGSLPALADRVDRSSGAPAWRPPGTPIGGAALGSSGSPLMTLGPFGMVPSTRGAPGAVGFSLGSNTSGRRGTGRAADPMLSFGSASERRGGGV